MSLDNQALPPEQYSAYVNGVYATPPVRTPQLPVLEYTLRDSGDGCMDCEIVVQIAYDVRRFRDESGEWEYEFQSDPMVVSISSVKQWLCGVELPVLVDYEAKQALIDGANQWLNKPQVDSDVRDKIMQHVRG